MPFTASQVWRAAKPIGAGASRIAGAALLAYAFILVLITASLQMSVTERLANLQPALDYNSGYSLWQDAVINRRALTTLRIKERKLLGDIAVAERKLQDALKEKLTFDDEKKDLIYALGCVLEKMGKAEEAIEQFKQIYEVDIGYKDVSAKVDAYYAGK